MAFMADAGGGSTTNVVTYSSLQDTANALEAARETMETCLNTATREFEATKGAFKSQQSNDIRQKFESLSLEFGSFKTAVDNYAMFLKGTAAKYQELDSTNA